MKHLFLGLITSAVITLTACNTNSGKKAEHTEHGTETTVSVGNLPQGHGDFSELFSHYQHLTFALSSDNDKEAAVAAKGILEALPKIKKDEFSEKSLATYGGLEANIKENAEHIVDNADNITHQREHLVTLSKDIYDIAKTFGINKPVYKVFCSMYNNDKGAYWISDSKEIKNPYFGAEMLSCGEIQEEIK